MSKVMKVIIESCVDCPSYDGVMDICWEWGKEDRGDGRFCRIVEDKYGMPEWCPLLNEKN